jgi:hypothetical protein
MRRAAPFFLSLALVTTSFVACGTTGGRPIALTLSVDRVGETRFTTATGWDVVLDEAHLLVGAIYAFAPEGLSARFERLERLLVPVAYAHGGLDAYLGRAVRCEWLSQADVDLVSSEATSLGSGAGSYGLADEGTVLLDAPRGALASADAPLRGHHAWISGTATRDATTIAFEGGIDVEDEGTARLVEGIPLGETLDDDGEVRVHVDVERWLDAVHFERLPDAGAAPRVMSPGTQGHTAWLLALRDPHDWSMTYVPPPAGSMEDL